MDKEKIDSLMDTDLYGLIGVTNTASLQEIKKAYRKKALSCHPDKNPNNPRAAELFHELSRALEILTDASARAAYDKVVNAKQQAALRVREFDAKRKKLKEDLEAREDAYKRSLNVNHSTRSDEDRLRAEIERLKKEGSKQVEEEIAYMRKKVEEELKGRCTESKTGDGSYKIKIKWKSTKNDLNDDAYDYDTLYRIFAKYGDVVTLVVLPTKEGRALVEYRNRHEAEMAVNTEVGLALNPLKLQKLWDTPKHTHYTSEKTTGKTNQSEMFDADFERSVLNNLRRAEEKKRSSAKAKLEEGT